MYSHILISQGNQLVDAGRLSNIEVANAFWRLGPKDTLYFRSKATPLSKIENTGDQYVAKEILTEGEFKNFVITADDHIFVVDTVTGSTSQFFDRISWVDQKEQKIIPLFGGKENSETCGSGYVGGSGNSDGGIVDNLKAGFDKFCAGNRIDSIDSAHNCDADGGTVKVSFLQYFTKFDRSQLIEFEYPCGALQ